MTRIPTEYILKGVFLGLVLYLAVAQAMHPPANYVDTLGPVNLCMLGGLVVIGLGLAAIIKWREGYRAGGKVLAFLLFLLLECPTLVYLGIIGGGVVGASYLIRTTDASRDLIAPMLGAGAFVGVIFALLRQVQKQRVRLLLILLLAGAGVATAYGWYDKMGGLEVIKAPVLFAIQLLLGIPFFYLLTFAGQEEESEIEIGAMCAFLALGFAILTHNNDRLRSVGKALALIPVALYFWYTWRVLPGLRVLKHAFRGYSYARVGRHRRALLAFRRALQLDPTNNMAREGFWQVHCDLDPQALAGDPDTLQLVDFDLCMDRAGSLLVLGKPTERQIDEATRLLHLIGSQRPTMEPMIDYWHAVMHTHQGALDEASAELLRVIDPSTYGADNLQRARALLPAWQLALVLHGELRRRVGEPQLKIPGRRMEAIAAAEQGLAENPDDPTAWDLKRELYRDLTEAEFDAVAQPDKAPPRCDYAYLRKLGSDMIQSPDQWRRGVEYLKLAARGLPASAPTLFVQIAQAHERANLEEEALSWFARAREAGREVGFKNLDADASKKYFATVKYLGEVALSKDDVEGAIENFKLYVESPNSGQETLRTLAELHERKGDPVSALRYTEQAVIYGKDADLEEKRKRYYISIEPDDLAARKESMKNVFNVDFCLDWARTILDAPYSSEMEWLEIVQRLLDGALVMQPESLMGKLLLARTRLRFGQRDEAVSLLAEVRDAKPEGWLSGGDEDAWYVANQLLGDLYMEVGKPDEAIPCFQDFRKSHRSGAKTLYKLGQAYEQKGDIPRAISFYKQVTAYEGNPLTSDAYDALHRLGA